MKCPTCRENTPDAWVPLYASRGSSKVDTFERGDFQRVSVFAMKCANQACAELLLRVVETTYPPGDEEPTFKEWLACPRTHSRAVDPLVPDPLKSDYTEAAAVLEFSPRMSAVMSRSILADLLEQYAQLDDFSLSTRVDNFRADTSHPSHLRESMHHFREIGNFGAHTQKNDQDQIIQVTQDEAVWMLDFLDRLFEYFIVGPEKDRQMRAAWDKNLTDTGRKAIDPL